MSTGAYQLWKQQCKSRKEDTLYFADLDISKFKHNCVIIDEIGDAILPSWSFTNDCEGFSLPWERLRSLGDDVKIGLEATGHYGQSLKLFLETMASPSWTSTRSSFPGSSAVRR